jgi:transcriptional regulator with XRE-family HTH domain
MKTLKEQLGARIKEIRKAKGLSQEKLSEKIEIDPKHLSRIEVGRNFPSLDTLAKLAKALRVEIKEFFEFAHAAENPKELKDILTRLTCEATKEELKIAVKVFRAIMI